MADQDNGSEATAAGASNEPVPLKPEARRSAEGVSRPELVRRTPEVRGSAGRSFREGGYAEGKKLIVGREIILEGSITACDKLIVEGRVEATLTDCRDMEVTEHGCFKGDADIEIAEVNGLVEGTLTARDLLLIRGKGVVRGTIRYGRLEIERGGKIEGDIRVYEPEVAAVIGGRTG